MIKVIAFDLVGVLVTEKDIELTNIEDKLERLFGPNLSDEDYINSAKKYIKSESEIISVTTNIINKLYKVKDKDIFKNLKNRYPDIKLVIATNHISYVKDYINKYFENIDDVIISSLIHKIKPNNDFYKYILNKYNIDPNELLFLDDNIDNINGASSLNINTILVKKDTNLLNEIVNYIES